MHPDLGRDDERDVGRTKGPWTLPLILILIIGPYVLFALGVR